MIGRINEKKILCFTEHDHRTVKYASIRWSVCLARGTTETYMHIRGGEEEEEKKEFERDDFSYDNRSNASYMDKYLYRHSHTYIYVEMRRRGGVKTFFKVH